MSDAITFTVSFRGTSHPFTLLPTTLLSTLFTSLSSLTSVPADLQKLIVKGKSLTLSSASERTLEEAGIKQGMKLMLMGSTTAELENLKGAEQAREAEAAERRRRELITRQRKTGSLRSTGSASSSSAHIQYRFHALAPLPHLPKPESALKTLEKLASDPAVLHLLETHKFSIGLLTELAPHEHPELLGLNQNKGEIIKLRLRTDAYDGFRLYSEVRRVLVHELTHCVWGDHDDNFKALNSQMNRELLAYELDLAKNAHPLVSTESMYQPAVSRQEEEDVEERRRRVLDAVLRRAMREEEELEGRCGSAGRGEV